jgi:hypothetical protein
VLQFCEEFSRQLIKLGLRVNDQQPNRLVRRVEVDDSSTTPFASAGTRPANLPATTATAYNVAGVGIGSDPRDELVEFIVGPDGRCVASEVRVSATVRKPA